MMTIQDLRREERRGGSPTDELLTLWGHRNHTVLELFALLSKMQHYQAMLILKDFGKLYYFNLFISIFLSAMWRRGRVTVLHIAVLGFIPVRVNQSQLPALGGIWVATD